MWKYVWDYSITVHPNFINIFQKHNNLDRSEKEEKEKQEHEFF